MTSPIDRLTAALTERLHWENVGNDSTLVRTDDLALVLAVVEAAEELVKTAEITAWSLSPTHPLRQAVSEYRSAALAAIEGSKE